MWLQYARLLLASAHTLYERTLSRKNTAVRFSPGGGCIHGFTWGGSNPLGGRANTDTHTRPPVPDATNSFPQKHVPDAMVGPEWTAMEGMPRYAELEIKALEALRRALLCECGFV